MKSISLFILMMILCTALMADIFQFYTFSSYTGAYSTITGTSVPTAVGDDVISTPIDIGFTFIYGTSPYTQVKVSSNGYVTLGTAPGSTLGNSLISTSFCPVVAPLWDDTGYAAVAYLLTGTAPNRIFTVQYTAMKWNYSSQTSFNMQVKLYETSKVEFVYDATASTPTNASASIGINMLPGGTGNFYSITPGNPASASTSVENSSVVTWPGTNMVYVFNPPIATPNDMAAISVTGNTTPSVGTTSNYNVMIRNFGTDPQTNYSVKLMSGTTELASVAGPAIQPATNANVLIPWVPTAIGTMQIYAKAVLVGDENPVNDISPSITVAVQAAGTIVYTLGDGSQVARIPMDMYYRASLYETVYQNSELNFIGMITGLSFYNTFTSSPQSKPTKIWLGTTTQTGLSNGWIPSTQLTQVYDGNVTYPAGQNTITITFPTPFFYVEGNLVMMVQRPIDTMNYNWDDNFFCQTVGSNRSLSIGNYNNDYDPASPPADAIPSGQFPKTGFMYIPGGVGHLTGTVYGAGNQPLANATVHILNGAQVTTNAVGHYQINNIIHGDYSVTVSRYGYYDSTQPVTIPEDVTVNLNVTLTQMPTVTLTGTIVGSDAPTVGLPGATITLTGYEDYEVNANAAGVFTVPGVYVNQTYQYMASGQGYQNLTGTVIVGTVNLDMGNITLNEIAYSPNEVAATVAAGGGIINLAWEAPDPNAVNVTQSFESVIFPPAEWSRIVTNNEPPNTSGVYPTWCRFGTVTVADVIVPPSLGEWQAGFWWSFNHQDEWLITPQFNCPQGANLSFDSNVFLGSQNGDHYYVKASGDNGATWTVLWDASAQTGGWNHYATPITLDLGQFTGQQIKLAWHADDPNTSNDGMWYVWFIDNIVVANETRSINFSVSDLTAVSAQKDMHTDDRSLVGYKVWRLPQGQEQNQAVWTLLTPEVITPLTYQDTDWATLGEGTYKWAVKASYTNDVLSLAMFSNPLVKLPVQAGSVAGVVHDDLNQSVEGALITIGTLSTTTAANGSYVLQVPVGTYSVTCTATGFVEQTQNNIIVTAGQTTPLNFILAPVSNDDQVVVDVTALKGNYPNPFNPETTLAFDVKTLAPVRIEIYNTKGQLIRTLVNEVKATGHYTKVWDGKDSKGNAVASGIYNYRMQAGSYSATRRMMLLK